MQERGVCDALCTGPDGRLTTASDLFHRYAGEGNRTLTSDQLRQMYKDFEVQDAVMETQIEEFLLNLESSANVDEITLSDFQPWWLGTGGQRMRAAAGGWVAQAKMQARHSEN